jgi:hypothetical protein
VERFHRTFRQEFLGGQIFSGLRTAQKALDTWIDEYNTERPHQSLGMLTPHERFYAGRDDGAPMPALDLTRLREDRSGDDWVARTVSAVGTISVSNQVLSVGRHRSGQTIDVRVTEKLLEAWSGNELLKTVLRTSKGVVRKKRAEIH